MIISINDPGAKSEAVVRYWFLCDILMITIELSESV
jgi:hypothetical protein